MSALRPRYNARATTRSFALKRVPRRNAPTLRRQYSAVAAAEENAGAAPRPRLLQPSVWDSIIPRGVRDGISARWRKSGSRNGQEEKESNSASFFIWIFLFIGSQSVRILGLKNEHRAYMRRADLKLAQLRDVVDRLHRGDEDVDVEAALGTGDDAHEVEWEEAMRELALEEQRWQLSREKAREEQALRDREQQDADPVNDHDAAKAKVAASAATTTTTTAEPRAEQTEAAAATLQQMTAPPRAPGFY